MQQTKKKTNAGRGFSIVELLVVIFIIGLVLSILVPAIGGVRQTAKRASTNAMMKDLATGANMFATDRKGQTPGYFPPAMMGSADNGNTRGFSGMQNVLLDLAGGVAQNQALDAGNGSACDVVGGPAVIEVGPNTDATLNVRVNLGAIGAPTKDLAKGTVVNAYYNPDRNALVRQCTPSQRNNGAPNEHLAMPELVDSWGNPVLAWSRDERATSTFAAIDSTAPAKFYWASNGGILRAQTLGRGGRDHSTASSSLYSMIGGGAATSSAPSVVGGAGRSGAMAAVLGNQAFPLPKTNPGDPDFPAQSRGALVFHSAGQDGWFLGSEDRGGRAASGPSGAGSSTLNYTANIDALSLFDDLINSALN